MSRIYQIASEQRRFLNQKGYNNNALNFKGMPDTLFTDFFNLLSEATIKTWPQNKSFEFQIQTAGKYEQLPGIVYFKFRYAYDPPRADVKLQQLNIQHHAKTIDIKLQGPNDLPQSSDIPDLIQKSTLIHRKYNIKSITKLREPTQSIKM